MRMISVVVCTYNRSRPLERMLKSVAQLRHPPVPWEVVVVENNCTDNTAQVVENFASNSRLTIRRFSEPKQGISHARITGTREAKGDVIAFTDDDVILDTQWLCEIYAAFSRADCLGIGGRIVPLWMSRKPSWLETHGHHSLMRAVLAFDLGESSCQLTAASAPFGANMCFRRSAFDKYGFFRTDLGKKGKSLMLGEDSEFCRRLLHAGEKLIYVPNAVVYHPVAEERLKKRFFCSWYFNFGRCTARTADYPLTSKKYSGVPRYLFNNLLQELSKWLSAFEPKQRFRHKLLLLAILGEISGSFEFARQNHRANESIAVRKSALGVDSYPDA
jgi:glycosyltransferase involved in cell wall biosynthesis